MRARAMHTRPHTHTRTRAAQLDGKGYAPVACSAQALIFQKPGGMIDQMTGVIEAKGRWGEGSLLESSSRVCEHHKIEQTELLY